MNTLQVTVLYFTDSDLRLRDESLELEVGNGGRAIIPRGYKDGKQIVAVLAGECHLLNRIGDRVLPISSASIAHQVDFE
ncbi:DUF2375 family protein [Echinimonas agarilytica]|uniref:DUF2375 family protein n=1 Tax=Echinimonas agarilytica TaxID=1215918 RepID=A0AA41W4A7_9GAMM|nr:DUF2375 family protein [Echinimonas agarilytica]MCM2678408.1 DUF2375 family protein [Echinimonas agarilytica]